MIHPRYRASHIIGLNPLAHNVEIFLDFNCPFSGKMFLKLQDEILPKLKAKGIDNKYSFTFVNVVQPWHGFQSSILHDVSFAVARVKPQKFWDVSRKLFEHIEQFYDSNVNGKTMKEVSEEILALCSSELDEDLESVRELIQLPSPDKVASNSGNGVAVDSKYFARYQRTLGIHVTPTVVVNGIVFSNIESSTSSDEIIRILESI